MGVDSGPALVHLLAGGDICGAVPPSSVKTGQS